MPRRINSRIMASLLQAGPIVQMILARRRAVAETLAAADACACFNLSPDLKGI